MPTFQFKRQGVVQSAKQPFYGQDRFEDEATRVANELDGLRMDIDEKRDAKKRRGAMNSIAEAVKHRRKRRRVRKPYDRTRVSKPAAQGIKALKLKVRERQGPKHQARKRQVRARPVA